MRPIEKRMKNDLQIVKESAQPARFKRWVPPVAGLLLVGVIGATYCGLHARAAVAAPKADSAEAKKLPTQELASSDFATVEARELSVMLPISGALTPLNQATVKSKVIADVS